MLQIWKYLFSERYPALMETRLVQEPSSPPSHALEMFVLSQLLLMPMSPLLAGSCCLFWMGRPLLRPLLSGLEGILGGWVTGHNYLISRSLAFESVSPPFFSHFSGLDNFERVGKWVTLIRSQPSQATFSRHGGSTSRPRTELACMYVCIHTWCPYLLSICQKFSLFISAQFQTEPASPRRHIHGCMQFSIIAHESPVTLMLWFFLITYLGIFHPFVFYYDT